MAIPKMRETPDAGLVTDTSIQFRIDQLAKENWGKPGKQTLARISALRARLPKVAPKEGEVIKPSAPVVNSALLASKKDIGWAKPQYYPD